MEGSQGTGMLVSRNGATKSHFISFVLSPSLDIVFFSNIEAAR